MASISEADAAFIASHPLLAALDSLRKSTQAPDTETKSASSDKTIDLSVLRDQISGALYALTEHPVAKRLKSEQGRPLNGLIASFYASLQSDTFDLSPFDFLPDAVANNTPDLEIWRSILHLADKRARVTTPPFKGIPASHFGTPWRPSSASHQGSDQTRTDLEQPLRMELANCTFVDLPEFFKQHFEGKVWSNRASDICEILRKANDGDLLKGFPRVHKEDKIWAWLDNFQNTYLAESLKIYRRTTSKGQTVTEAERQFDLVLQPRNVSTTDNLDISHVGMVAELTSSAKSNVWVSKFIQLAVYIRDVFTKQPTRPYVHAFLLFKSQMQLWVFDRSGAYSSETFDIFEQAERFIHVIVGYTLMTEEELGRDTFIQRAGNETTVSIKDAATSEDYVIGLTPTPFVVRRSIVSRATACHVSLDGKHVIKFSWRPAERKAESEYLRLAEGVSGVAQLKGSRDIISVRDLRQGLTFTPELAKKIPLEDPIREELAQLSSKSKSGKSLKSQSIGSSKRSSTGKDDRPAKRSRLSSLQLEDEPDDEPKDSRRILDPPHLFQNRILTCVAISPVGRPLSKFESVKELLTGMRDAIRGHKSLFMQKNILHRDVSEHNIILTDEKEHGCAGALIDLDLAVMVDDDGKNEQSESRVMTGTLEFMALENLEGGMDPATAGIEHTYRHDLESFFYVLVIICTKHGWGNERLARLNQLQDWYTGSIRRIYSAKRGALDPLAFEILILRSFSPLFAPLKPLARELRDILFSKGFLRIGTDKDPEPMYNDTIKAYENAIETLC